MTEVTAIVNSHNAEKVVELLPRALESVLAQDIEGVEWEVILVNDGEPMQEIIDLAQVYSKKFEDNGVAFTFFGTEEESGYQCRPKNVAIWHAQGEYLSFLDYDNEWTPNHLRVLYEAITEGTVWDDFVYGRRRYVIDEGCEKEMQLPSGGTKTLPEGDTELVEWNQKTMAVLGSSPMGNFVDTSDFMTSKGSFWRLQMATGKMWNESFRRFGDWELLARAAFFAGWRGKAVDEIVNIYHWTGDNLQLTRPWRETPEKENA